MSSPNYIGYGPDHVSNITPKRYFYGLRRNEDGELFITRIDQLKDDASIEINIPGAPGDSYVEFAEAVDFFEGRTEEHDIVFPNLNFEQYRWDNRIIYYFIDQEGQWVLRTGQEFIPPEGISSDK